MGPTSSRQNDSSKDNQPSKRKSRKQKKQQAQNVTDASSVVNLPTPGPATSDAATATTGNTPQKPKQNQPKQKQPALPTEDDAAAATVPTGLTKREKRRPLAKTEVASADDTQTQMVEPAQVPVTGKVSSQRFADLMKPLASVETKVGISLIIGATLTAMYVL
jgi:hypothetical protein